VNQDFKVKFMEALENDFNIPQALSIVFELLKSNIASADKYATIIDFDQVLGLGLADLQEIEIPEEIKQIAEARWLAKQNKDWPEADRWRDKLSDLGWQMEDNKADYKLKKN